jgi:hypothetical protein
MQTTRLAYRRLFVRVVGAVADRRRQAPARGSGQVLGKPLRREMGHIRRPTKSVADLANRAGVAACA